MNDEKVHIIVLYYLGDAKIFSKPIGNIWFQFEVYTMNLHIYFSIKTHTEESIPLAFCHKLWRCHNISWSDIRNVTYDPKKWNEWIGENKVSRMDLYIKSPGYKTTEVKVKFVGLVIMLTIQKTLLRCIFLHVYIFLLSTFIVFGLEIIHDFKTGVLAFLCCQYNFQWNSHVWMSTLFFTDAKSHMTTKMAIWKHYRQ